MLNLNPVSWLANDLMSNNSLVRNKTAETLVFATSLLAQGQGLTGAVIGTTTAIVSSVAKTSAMVAGSVGCAVLGYKAGCGIYHSALENKISDKLWLKYGWNIDKAYKTAKNIKTIAATTTLAASCLPLAYTVFSSTTSMMVAGSLGFIAAGYKAACAIYQSTPENGIAGKLACAATIATFAASFIPLAYTAYTGISS